MQESSQLPCRIELIDGEMQSQYKGINMAGRNRKEFSMEKEQKYAGRKGICYLIPVIIGNLSPGKEITGVSDIHLYQVVQACRACGRLLSSGRSAEWM